ncbi:hypothetical protein [Streptomyces sp. NPDC002889]|uniref:hypothetical protein n=1 Tax=Streptomyces sp. NPDC002889 TaxID=3364669 RepID=UPI0036BA7D40
MADRILYFLAATGLVVLVGLALAFAVAIVLLAAQTIRRLATHALAKETDQ